MRELILQKIEEIAKGNNNFDNEKFQKFPCFYDFIKISYVKMNKFKGVPDEMLLDMYCEINKWNDNWNYLTIFNWVADCISLNETFESEEKETNHDSEGYSQLCWLYQELKKQLKSVLDFNEKHIADKIK